MYVTAQAAKNGTEHSGVPEFASFAAGLRREHKVVMAALSCAWSNGQTEGR